MIALTLALAPLQSAPIPRSHLLVNLGTAPSASTPRDGDPAVLAPLGMDELLVSGRATTGTSCVWRTNTTTGQVTAIGTEIPEFAKSLAGGPVLYGARPSGAFGSLDLFALQDWPAPPVTLLDSPFADTAVAPLVEWRGELWLLGRTNAAGRELMRTDGTEAGTLVAEELVPGSSGLQDGALFVAGDQLFLAAQVSGTGSLYVLGDPAGTLTPLGAFAGGDGPVVTEGIEFRGELWFSASTAAAGTELYRSDGTPAGTGLAADLTPGVEGSDPRFLAAGPDHLYLQAGSSALGRELFAVDATGAAGLVTELRPGPDSGLPDIDAAILGDRLVFAGDSASLGLELFQSDGTAAGTQAISNPPGSNDAAPERLVAAAGLVYLAANAAGGDRELYATDGTPAGTRQITFGPSGGVDPVPYDTPGGLVFSGNSEAFGRELFRTSGQPGDATLVANIAVDSATVSSSPRNLVRFGSRLAWSAAAPGSPRQVWFSEGTQGNAAPLPFDFGAAGNLDLLPQLTLGSRLLLTARNTAFITTLWSTDGTPGGTVQVQLPGAAADASIAEVTAFGELPLAVVEESRPDGTRRLALTDGTTAGTTILYEDDPDVHLFDLGRSVFQGGRLYFVGGTDAAGSELWSTDGTPAGTGLLADLNPGPSSSNPITLVALDDRMLAMLEYNFNDRRLATSDGTPAGTIEYYDPNTSPFGNVLISGLVSVGSTALFTYVRNDTSADHYRTDGTAAGTVPTNNLPFNLYNPGSAYQTDLFTAVRGLSAFNLNPGFPQTLVVSDGTFEGTITNPVSALGTYDVWSFGEIRGLGGTRDVLFPGRSLATGREPWIFHTDGTPTEPIDVLPGPDHSGAIAYTALGDRLFFTADDGANGVEVHYIDLSELGAYAAEPFGQACSLRPVPPAIDFDGDARLGLPLIVELSNAEPGAAGLLFRSLVQSFLPVEGCTVYLGAPKLLALGGTDAAGDLSLSIPIPADPALAGLRLTLQFLVGETGGPIAGALATTRALEVVIAE